MSTLHIKNAQIIWPGSKWHRKTADVIIENGITKAIGQNLNQQADEVITGKKLILTPGWFDLHVSFNDPGNEHKEDIISGSQAAQHGGFTDVLLMPDSQPAIDSKSVVNYIKGKAQLTETNIHIAGAASEGLLGEDITEVYDMKDAGIVALTDHKNAIQNADLLRRVLFYAKKSRMPVMSFASDKSLNRNGQMNEGKMSTSLGLKGMPSLSEEIQLKRDIDLAKYCDSPIHFSSISSKESVEIIRSAKDAGIPVTCDVSYMNLALTDKDLEDFDTNLKLNPPLRTEADRKALIEGLKDGTIDAISTDHTPQNIEEKAREFDNAAFGMSSLETIYPVYNTFLKDNISIELFVDKLAVEPRQLIGLLTPQLEEGKPARATVLDPSKKTEIDKSFFKSKSKNNYWLGSELKGVVVKTINGK
jgi:dihydroorotase